MVTRQGQKQKGYSTINEKEIFSTNEKQILCTSFCGVQIFAFFASEPPPPPPITKKLILVKICDAH